jgi:hypothetical protein
LVRPYIPNLPRVAPEFVVCEDGSGARYALA